MVVKASTRTRRPGSGLKDLFFRKAETEKGNGLFQLTHVHSAHFPGNPTDGFG
jgi:hypothetical protein